MLYNHKLVEIKPQNCAQETETGQWVGTRLGSFNLVQASIIHNTKRLTTTNV